MQRDALEIADGLNFLFFVLDGEHVIVSRFRIDPETWRNHAVGSERGDHVVHHFFGRKSRHAGSFAIDIEFESRIVEILRNQNAADAAQLAHLRGNIARQVVTALQIVGAHLNIDRRGQALIHHRIHQAAGGEIGRDLRQIVGELAAHALHVGVGTQLVIFLQTDLHEGRIHSRVAGINRRKIWSDSDIREDHSAVVLGHYFLDVLLDARQILVGQFNARACRRFHANHKLAGIGAGEKGHTDERVGGQAENYKRSESDYDESGPRETLVERAVVFLLQPAVVVVETENRSFV